MKRLVLLAAIALAACQPEAGETGQSAAAPPVEPQAAAPAAPATPSGPSRTVEAEKEPMPAAWVTDVRPIKDTDAKIFSTAGGDPAINGLYTYFALYTAPDGWTRVFMIGDFNSWEVVEESPSGVVLKVSRSWIEEATGDIKTAEEKLIIGMPEADDATLTVTPAT